MPQAPSPLRGTLWLALAVFSWAGLFPLAKRTLPVLDAFALGSARYALGIVLFVAILWVAEGARALRYGARLVPACVFGVVGFCGFNLLVWWGLVYTRPEHAAIILSLQSALTALALWLVRGLRPARFTLGCVGVAIAGVLVVVTEGDPAALLAGGSLVGDLLVFLGALSWVAYSLSGPLFAGWSPLRMTVLTAIPGTVGLIAIHALAIAAGWSQAPSLEELLSVKWQLAYFAVFTVVLGVLGFNNGVRHLGALNAMLTLNLIPVIVFAIEAALGRSFSMLEIAGATLVIGALAANNLYLRARAAENADA